ncbi:MAG: hypothetical protein QOE65_1135 [Solirubrobacteraceae bacterium]|nr:hypothetical protein [Solirubrobacteraceae bacterium]
MAYMRSPHGLRPLAILCGATIALLSTAAGPTPTARAGTFTAWYCRTGSNAGLVLQDWVRFSVGVGYTLNNFDLCVTPDGRPGQFGLSLLVDSGNNPDSVGDAFAVDAPTGVRLSAVRLWWAGEADANGRVSAVTLRPGELATDPPMSTLAAYTNTSFDAGRTIEDGGAPAIYALNAAQAFSVRAECLAACRTDPNPIASFGITRAAFSVSDSNVPEGQATGDLLVDPVLAGHKSVIVQGTDRGAGVYLARVLVDGEVRASAAFGSRACRDIDPSNADPYEFAYLQPCPGSASTTILLDTMQLGEDAYHHVQVEMLDAAGNSAMLADRTVGVDNQLLPAGFFDPATRHFLNPLFDIASPRRVNGVGGGSGAKLRLYFPNHRQARAGTRTVRFRARPTVRAQLSDAQQRPIANAQVWLATRTEGGEWRIEGQPLLTSRTGRVGFRLTEGLPSRAVNLVYFPYSDSHEQAVGRPLALNVRAGAILHTDRRVVRNRQRVTFSGSVEGSIPAGGLSISLQARVGHRYRSFRQLRVTPESRGRFTTGYRFTATTRTTRYRFRVFVLKQSGMPFANGSSAVRTVLVRP